MSSCEGRSKGNDKHVIVQLCNQSFVVCRIWIQLHIDSENILYVLPLFYIRRFYYKISRYTNPFWKCLKTWSQQRCFEFAKLILNSKNAFFCAGALIGGDFLTLSRSRVSMIEDLIWLLKYVDTKLLNLWFFRFTLFGLLLNRVTWTPF